MEGGKGNDTYIVNSVNDVVLEQQNEGYDTVISSVNYILNANIEELRLLEGYTINGTGNSLNNRIIGNSRDNILDGVTGADTMMAARAMIFIMSTMPGIRWVELAGEGWIPSMPVSAMPWASMSRTSPCWILPSRKKALPTGWIFWCMATPRPTSWIICRAMPSPVSKALAR
jgi:hypothetical protein